MNLRPNLEVKEYCESQNKCYNRRLEKLGFWSLYKLYAS